jgi:hypothetical protein
MEITLSMNSIEDSSLQRSYAVSTDEFLGTFGRIVKKKAIPLQAWTGP